MKKLLLTAIIGLFSVALFAQQNVYKPIKGIENRGFEDSELTLSKRTNQPEKGKMSTKGWYYLYANSINLKASGIVSDEVHTGEKAFKSVTNGEAKVMYKGLLRGDAFKVEKPGRYRMSFWVKASKPALVKLSLMPSKDAKLTNKKVNEKGKPVFVGYAKPKTENMEVATEWTLVYKEIQITKKDIQAGYVYYVPSLMHGASPNTTFWIDDFSMDYVAKKKAQ
ncbi:hypothetical protein [Flammeovirga kamogawensis]|uniref:DUF4198 domain-containing protein n=1 Tax=Flammeovirga kamogawensis TaxID=373891 RepID=A0ABX8H163_9BACT|nr:hypothetical protein [Flammeovirga kamogawensis]MBB6462624.1 hypothetical protein [Flammeovirga kamogawensis]QWG09631.1 hypothetical protein KM029_23800 [Flammeovirga kamogawensis]TRX65145.1 hypothetical protein EO216_21700 [Flammeovirga kamogawensis]